MSLGDWQDVELRSGWRIIAGTVLGMLALLETVARFTARSTGPAPLSIGGPIARHAATHAGIGWQSLFVLCLVALATVLPLAFLRPLAAAVACCVAGIVSLAVFDTLTVAGAAAVLAVLYRLGRVGPQLVACGLGLPFAVLALADPEASEAGVVLTILVATLGPTAALVGAALRTRSEVRETRTVRQNYAGTLLEHTARGERARIARELHDVVAHHISMVAVQAETARLTTPGMPAAGAQRLAAIGDTARAALTEMRRVLGVLREDVRTTNDERPADRQPQPGIRQLGELLDDAREASGAAVRLIVVGSPDALDPGVELAAYRIVQEALTNARRHAPGAAIDVELRYSDESLRLRIRDNGPGPKRGTPSNGHGLLGMRERAAAVGGSLRTGPAAIGGFLVETVLPLNAPGTT